MNPPAADIRRLKGRGTEILRLIGLMPEREIAEHLGMTRQRVSQVRQLLQKCYPEGDNLRANAMKALEYEYWPSHWYDTGCPDGTHPSCLNCPEPQCPFEDRPIGRPPKAVVK